MFVILTSKNTERDGMLHGVDEQRQVAATKKEQEQKFNFINISSSCLWSNDDYFLHKYQKKKKNTVDLPYLTASRKSVSWNLS